MVQLEETVRGCERTADRLTSELSESRDKFEREMQVTKENTSKLTEQLNFQINILSGLFINPLCLYLNHCSDNTFKGYFKCFKQFFKFV